jgi:hypothetical protein
MTRRNAATVMTPWAIMAIVVTGFVGFVGRAWMPADAQEIRYATILAKVGPKSAEAYAEAVGDGSISNEDMRNLRQEAFKDLEEQDRREDKP